MSKAGCFIVGLVALALWSTTAMAGSSGDASLTARERVLLQKLEMLEQRVADLEERLEKKDRQKAETKKLEKRVETVEKVIEDDLAPQPEDFRVYWKSGLNFASTDGRFKLKINGRIQHDWAFFDQDDDLEWMVGDDEDGTEFRRVRLALSGTLYDNIEFKTQYDFASGEAEFKDVYIAFREVPYIGKLTLGQQYEPFSLDSLTSSKYNTFMERSLPEAALSIGRNVGVRVDNNAFDERITWAFGVFKDADDTGSAQKDGDMSVTARVTGLPWYVDDGEKLLHLGVGYSYRNPDTQVRTSVRPSAHLARRYLDTGDVTTDQEHVYGLEAALKLGAFSMQGEYIRNDMDTEIFGDVNFDGYYLYASYFLTGEGRAYDTGEGDWGRVKPRHNFGWGDTLGWGAWEVALRYASVDLDDGWVKGGQMNDWTLGLNWYMNPNTRLMLNYVHADVDHVLYNGDVDVLQGRLHMNF